MEHYKESDSRDKTEEGTHNIKAETPTILSHLDSVYVYLSEHLGAALKSQCFSKSWSFKFLQNTLGDCSHNVVKR